MIGGHERVEVDVTELRDAKAVKHIGKALEHYPDLADNSLMRLIESISDGTRSQHTCA